MLRLRVTDGKPVESSMRRWLANEPVEGPFFLQLTGSLKAADICPSPDSAPVEVSGSLYIVSAQATVDGDRTQTMGVVSWSDNGVPRMLAGRLMNLVADRVDAYLMFHGQAFEPSRAPAPVASAAPSAGGRVSDYEAATLSQDDSFAPQGLPPVPEVTIEMPKVSPAKGTMDIDWSKAVDESTRLEPQQPESATVELRRGDILIHPRFGRCQVARDAMFGKIKVRRPTGALMDLHMKVLEFTRGPDDHGRRVYKLSISKP